MTVLKYDNVFKKPCDLQSYILSLFDVLPNSLITTSETLRNYCLWRWYTQVALRVAEGLKAEDLRKIGNIRKVSKVHSMIS